MYVATWLRLRSYVVSACGLKRIVSARGLKNEVYSCVGRLFWLVGVAA